MSRLALNACYRMLPSTVWRFVTRAVHVGGHLGSFFVCRHGELEICGNKLHRFVQAAYVDARYRLEMH
jgi:hypothetical protein